MTGSSAVNSERTKDRPPHPLEAEFNKVGLTAQIVDDFPTQPWGGRAWCDQVADEDNLKSLTAWEPCANRGFLVRGLRDYFANVICSDIFDYGAGFPVFNFLDLAPGMIGTRMPDFVEERPDWVVSNPPFVRVHEFIATALSIARVGVAMLCRTQIMETVGRYQDIYVPYAGRWAFSQFVERLPMQEAQCLKSQGTKAAYGWLTIWHEPQDPTFLLSRRHIAPCRKRLERAGDYA